MKTIEPTHDFLDAFVRWASTREDMQAIALVGSYARGAARTDSDIDVVLLTDEPQIYLEDIRWIDRYSSNARAIACSGDIAWPSDHAAA